MYAYLLKLVALYPISWLSELVHICVVSCLIIISTRSTRRVLHVTPLYTPEWFEYFSDPKHGHSTLIDNLIQLDTWVPTYGHIRRAAFIHRSVVRSRTKRQAGRAISRDLAVDSGNKHACHMKWKAELLYIMHVERYKYNILPPITPYLSFLLLKTIYIYIWGAVEPQRVYTIWAVYKLKRP